MSTRRRVIWRAAQNTAACRCASCTKCTGSGRIDRPPARRKISSPAAGRQPGGRTPARQQITSPAAARQPGSSPPARQQPASPAAARQPGSSPAATSQATRPAAMLYTRLRGRAHPLRAALMFPRVPARARGTARAPACYAGSEARKLGRFVIFFGISVRAGRKKRGLKLSGKD